MNTKWLLLLAGLVSNSASLVRGADTNYTLDLTNKDAAKNVKWSNPKRITITPQGLGFGKSGDGMYDFWLETEPFGIGRSDQTVTIAMIDATIRGPGGMLYVRYSADKTHWTAWQYLGGGGKVHGTVRVPGHESSHYQDLRLKYKGSEEALVKEILSSDPEFFENSTPFIGYLQFLYEVSLPGGQRIERIHVGVDWTLHGMRLPEKGDLPWRFNAEENNSARDKTSKGASAD